MIVLLVCGVKLVVIEVSSCYVTKDVYCEEMTFRPGRKGERD